MIGFIFYHLFRFSRKSPVLGKVVLTLIYRLRILNHATDEWYWKLTTLLYAGEEYALPGKGGGINSVIRWQQMYWQSPLKARCSDKIAVRGFIRERLGDEYLIPMLPAEGVFWTNPDEIDFEQLPNRFVLKLNNGSGMNLIVGDKTKLDITTARETMRKWLVSDFAKNLREWHYRDIPNRIYCEEFINFCQEPSVLGQSTSGDGGRLLSTPLDYKLMCSNGEVLFAWVDSDRFTEHHRDIYDVKFNRLNVSIGYPPSGKSIPKPKNWTKMIAIAEALSRGIPLVRVDLYNVAGRIYFGEMTFTSDSGTAKTTPLSFSIDAASRIDLSPYVKGA